MPYSDRLEIPFNTTEADPASVEIGITPAKITSVELTFPSGCVGLVGAWFTYQDQQIWPITPKTRFRGNDQQILFRPNIDLLEPPHTLTLWGINEDDTFPHTVYAVIDVEFPGGFFETLFSRLFPGGGAVALRGR